MPSKFHDEGLRISALHRRKVLLECPPSKASCASTIVSGSTCVAPSEPCPRPPPYCTKCKPYWAEFNSNYIHHDLRPFITSTQVHEIRPAATLRFLRKTAKMPRIEYKDIKDDKSDTASTTTTSTTTSKPSSAASAASSFPSIPSDQLPSVELRAGAFYPRCLCSKRNGLQDQCPRTGCGLPECILVPPKCIPGGGPGPDTSVVAPENGTSKEDDGSSGTADKELKNVKALGNMGYLCCNPKCPVLERSRKAAEKAAKEVPRKQARELPDKRNVKMEYMTVQKLSYGPPFGDIKRSRRKSKDGRDGRDERGKNDGNRRDVLKDSEDARLTCHVHLPERPVVSPEELNQLLRVCGTGDYGKKELDSLHAALCCNPQCPAAAAVAAAAAAAAAPDAAPVAARDAAPVAAGGEKTTPTVPISPEGKIRESPALPKVRKGDFVCSKSDCPYITRDSAKYKGDKLEGKVQPSKDETEKRSYRENRTDEGQSKLDKPYKPYKGKPSKHGNICCNPSCPGLEGGRRDKISKLREEKAKSKRPIRGDLCCNPDCLEARKGKENNTKKLSDDKKIASVPVLIDLCCNPKCPDAAKARAGNKQNEREERHQNKEKGKRAENICCNPNCPDASNKEKKEQWNRQVQRA